MAKPAFFETIQSNHREGINSLELVKIKLLECLYLLASYDKNQDFDAHLAKAKIENRKRNLARLMKNNDILQLSVADLAHLSGRSLSSFNRNLKVTYEMSPKQWLQDKRMSHAKKLLESDKHSVTYVASLVGYNNSSHFIKAFKEKYQVTPNQLKNKISLD